MTLLILRPESENGESLSSYLYRLAKANIYPSGSSFAQLLDCHISKINNNDFDPVLLERISKFCGKSYSELELMSLQRYRDVLGPLLFEKMVQLLRIKYCPECILDGGIKHYLDWMLVPLNICVKHSCMLVDACISCSAPIYMNSFMDARCRCGSLFAKTKPSLIPTKSFVFHSQQDLVHRINNQTKSIIFPELTIRQYLKLAYHSFYLLEGTYSYIEGEEEFIQAFIRKKNRQQSVETATNSFANVYWMYSEFPKNFYLVLDQLHNSKHRSKYEKKAAYEAIFSENIYIEIKKAYEAYWLQRLDKGEIRKDFSIFKSNEALLNDRDFVSREEVKERTGIGYQKVRKLAEGEYVKVNSFQKGVSRRYNVEKTSLQKALTLKGNYMTRKEASLWLGIQKDAVSKIILSGYLKVTQTPFSRDTLLLCNDVVKLMRDCRGKLLRNSRRGLAFHQVLRKYAKYG